METIGQTGELVAGMTTTPIHELERLANRVRWHILTSTSAAGSGHPTSSLSAADLLTGLFFGGNFRYDIDDPDNPNNDRLVLSKGHASPLLYALWAAAGKVTEEELLAYRKFGSSLEGHPSIDFPYVDVATGSLGQGLSIGFGLALNARYLDELPYRTYVLLGDGEMAEGSQWESIELAAHYGLDNLIGILDVNGLGQSGETMYGHDLKAYRGRIESFGWRTLEIDGHLYSDVLRAYEEACRPAHAPLMIIARTVKGKGISFLENQRGWHGKALNREQCDRALEELGEVELKIEGEIARPEKRTPKVRPRQEVSGPEYDKSAAAVATRDAYGHALNRIYGGFPALVSLDGDVSNSTRAEYFQEEHLEQFFEMYIAEQNMVGAALGLSVRGKIPFVSTFAAFLTRAFDQIRMCQYSDANIKFVGSHAGVSIGEDGPSQMGLEDIAMFRTLLDSTVLYPCDAVSAERVVEAAAECRGIVYLRMTRSPTPIIYDNDESFPIGGCKVLRSNSRDLVTVVAAGITVHEALAAFAELEQDNLLIRVIDLYSVKPLDEATLRAAARDTRAFITVEDHVAAGGLGEAVRSALCDLPIPIHSLAVRKKPRSGTPAQLLDYEDISSRAIVEKVRELVHERRGREDA